MSGVVAGVLGIAGIAVPPLLIVSAVVGGASAAGSLARWYGCKIVQSELLDQGKKEKEDIDQAWKEFNKALLAFEDLDAVPELKSILENFEIRMSQICDEIRENNQSEEEQEAAHDRKNTFMERLKKGSNKECTLAFLYTILFLGLVSSADYRQRAHAIQYTYTDLLIYNTVTNSTYQHKLLILIDNCMQYSNTQW